MVETDPTEGHQAGKTAESGGSPLVQSLSRGLLILGQFTADSKTLSLTELSRCTGLHKATVHRFVKTLEAEGFLTSVDAGTYTVGPVWAMSLAALGSENVFAEILACDLQELAETTLETVAIGVRRGDWVHVAHVLPPGRSFIPVLPPSHLHPLHASWNVHSQVLMAFADEDLRRRMLAVPQTRYTRYTVVDAEDAATKSEQVRKEGVAYDRQEFREGTCAVGVPVRSRDRVVAALALVMPVERFTDSAVSEYIGQLRRAAENMGERLDGSTEA